MSPRNILVVGHYGAGNIGDEAVLAGALQILRDASPGCWLHVMTQDVEETSRLHGVDAVHTSDQAAVLSSVAAADLVVLGGGGPLFDYGGLEASLVVASDEAWASYYHVPGLAAAAGKPVVMLGQGVGPIAGAGGRQAIGSLARSMAALTVRDTGSRALLLSLGVDPSRVEVTSDLAFAAPVLQHPVHRRPVVEEPYVVISVRSPVLPGQPTGLPEVLEAAVALHETHGLRILLVPFQDRDVDDFQLGQELASRLPLGSVAGVLEPGPGHLERAASAVAGAALVVGMRLHSLLFALAVGVPVVALSYDPKVRSLMTEAGLGHRCLDVVELRTAALTALVDEVLADREGESARSAAAGQRMRLAGQRHRDVIQEVLAGTRPPAGDSGAWLGHVRRDVASLRSSVQALTQQRAEQQSQMHELRRDLSRQLEEQARRLTEGERLHAEQEQQLQRAQEELQRAQEEIRRISEQLGRSTTMLRREETSVVRPVARRAYRAAQVAGRRLSPDAQQRVRAAMAPVARIVASKSPQAAAYAQARRALDAQSREPATVQQRGGAVGDRLYSAGPGTATLTAGAAGSLDFLVFPVIDWHFRVQRPQHLSTHLADRGHRVVYLTTEFEPWSPGSAPFRVLESPAAGVWVVRLTCPPPLPRIYSDPMTDQQQEALSEALLLLERELGLARTVLVAHHPFWEPLLRATGRGLMVYDLIDDHEGFEGTAPWVLDAEKRLIAAADLVTVTAPTLGEKAPGAVLVRNAAEVERFSTRPAQVHRSGRPTVGYFGAIAHWFDTATVERCARERPDWDVVLIGSTFGADVSGLQQLPNVRLLGELPYEDLPSHLHGFDVCIIPFHVIPLTQHTNPVKAYEYLAAGKPVVATAMPEVLLMQPWVHVAHSPQAFLDALDAAMAEVGDAALAERRREWAAQHTWAERAELVEQAVQQRLPRVSVIVLCYNNLALTKSCLDSLDRLTGYTDWELVVVDNASTDGTADFLRTWAAGRDHVRLVLNEENLGFAGGNNSGLAVATGDVLVMLNNDTYVTPGWLLSLTRHLRDDPTLGLVGPLTNNIGNEAKVDLEYDDMEQMLEVARRYTSSRFRQLLRVPTVAFFCVAMRRDVYEQIGGLDEDFGVGFFEDDDYCRRVSAAGYAVAIAEDVFVHHHLSASFDALGAARKQELFEKNKAVYEAKWGEWTPHAYRAGGRT